MTCFAILGLIFLFNSGLYAMDNRYCASPEIEQIQLQLINKVKVNFAYPLLYDRARDKLLVPAAQENPNDIGIFDELGKEVSRLEGNDCFIWDLKGIAENPYILISCSCDVKGGKGKIMSWNLATRKPIALYEPEKETLLTTVLGFKNKAGEYIVAVGGGVDRPLLYLINALTGELTTKCSGTHTKRVFSIEKLNDEDWFATIQDGGEKICIWDLQGTNVATINASDTFIHKYSPVMALLANSTLGSFVVSHDAEQTIPSQPIISTISFWSTQNNFAEYAQFKWSDLVTALRVSEDNQFLATGGLKGTLTLWQLNQIKNCEPKAQLDGHKSKVNDIQFLQAKKWLVTASGNDKEEINDDISVRVWDFEGNQLACLQSDCSNELEYIQITRENEFVVASTAGDLFFLKLVNQPQQIERGRARKRLPFPYPNVKPKIKPNVRHLALQELLKKDEK